MTRSKTIIATVLTVATLGLGGLAIAQPDGHGGHGWGGPGGRGRFSAFAGLRQLDLTDAQRTQIRGIVDQHKADFQAVGEKLRAARKAQTDAIEATPADETQIRARTTELAAAQADAAVLRSRVHAEIFAVLTPEQQEKAKALKAEHEQRRADMRKRWEERRQQKQQQPQQ